MKNCNTITAMNDHNKTTIDEIMKFDLTWRQKKTQLSLHLAAISGLITISVLTQLI